MEGGSMLGERKKKKEGKKKLKGKRKEHMPAAMRRMHGWRPSWMELSCRRRHACYGGIKNPAPPAQRRAH